MHEDVVKDHVLLRAVGHQVDGIDAVRLDMHLVARRCQVVEPEIAKLVGGAGGNQMPVHIADRHPRADKNLVDFSVGHRTGNPPTRNVEVVEVASSADANYTFIPKDWTVPADVDYLHITTNNTIYGTEMRKDLDVNVPLIADMSSDIFSRPIDVKKYDAIYAGAQKNLAMAGVTIVIVKDEKLGKAPREIPTMLDYRTHVEKGSMFNTPPVVPIYSALETLRWIKKNGGVETMDKLAQKRAEIVYGEIDRNKLFRGTAATEDRSLMNICFVMNDEYKELEKEFLDFAVSKGMVGVKGHRSVGGFRASCYNAQTIEGCEALVACMKEFEAKH